MGVSAPSRAPPAPGGGPICSLPRHMCRELLRVSDGLLVTKLAGAKPKAHHFSAAQIAFFPLALHFNLLVFVN